MDDEAESAALVGFGFTPIESRAYCELLRQAPATGYRLAQAIGKAPTNTYQALRSLTQKGAIVPMDRPGDATHYIPVPPDELLAKLEQGFVSRKMSALASLKQIHAPSRDEAVYQLREADQVFARAREMLSSARETIVFDMVPTLHDLLHDDLQSARARGVEVTGIAYRAQDDAPGMAFAPESGKTVEQRWPGLGMIVVVDGNESLIAQISRDLSAVLNAVYSDSVFLSCILHTTVVSDIRLNVLQIDPGASAYALTLGKRVSPGHRRMTDAAGSAPKT